MLTPLDETFLHQSPHTFDQTPLSDHRFFDRIWLGGCDQSGQRFMMGLGAYKNTNTFDGYAVVLRDGKQHNLRASRPLLPNPAQMGVGPICVEVAEPLKAIRVLVRPSADAPLAADLLFTASVPAHEEARHVRRVDGRLVQDYLRYDQIGKLSGWFEVEGVRRECTNWFAARDHSWGIRPGMGGYEPPTSAARAGEHPGDISAGMEGFLVVWLAFEAGDYAGYLQQLENGAGGVVYTDGHIFRREGEELRKLGVRSIEHELSFVPGTRTCDAGLLIVTLEDGQQLRIEVHPHIPPAVYKGAGYDLGFNDERGLGLHRGFLVEYDVYDVSHPEDVRMPDGRVIRPWHREATCSLVLEGRRGLGHFPVISVGHIRRYGLRGEVINRREP